MNHDFDEEIKRTGERRSRRNPRMQGDRAKRTPEDGAKREAVRQTAAAQVQTPPKGTASGMSPQAEARIKQAKRRRRIIAMIVAECFALMFIFGYAYVAKRWNSIQRPDFDKHVVKNTDLDVETVEKMKGYWTIAVFGVDDRGKVIDKSTNADVNMICNINMDTGEIRLVSVFRDSYLNISEDGSYNKLNQAYFRGGPQQAVAALNRNMDLDITHYVTFNWKAVADAINILGGIDLEISKTEYHYINSFITETVKATGIPSKHLTSAGMNHLDGVQAVAYGRLRLMDTDFARTERQRKVVALAFEKAKKADIGVLNNIAEVVFEQVATNIELKDVIYMAMNISKYHLGETIGFPMARGDANMGKKGSVVVPQTLESNVMQIHEFLFGAEEYTPTSTVKNISAKIAADSGMYKEGKYIDKVSTDGGVIQPPKQTASETKGSSGSEKESSTRESERETDENGNVIKETSGSATKPGATTEATKPGSTMPSTNERPGIVSPEESSPSRPGGEEETSATRPGPSVGTSAVSPGSTTEPTTSSTGPGSPSGGTSSPGGSSTQPGNNDEVGTIIGPGSETSGGSGNSSGPPGSGTGSGSSPGSGTGSGSSPGSGTGSGSSPGSGTGSGSSPGSGTGSGSSPGSGTGSGSSPGSGTGSGNAPTSSGGPTGNSGGPTIISP